MMHARHFWSDTKLPIYSKLQHELSLLHVFHLGNHPVSSTSTIRPSQWAIVIGSSPPQLHNAVATLGYRELSAETKMPSFTTVLWQIQNINKRRFGV